MKCIELVFNDHIVLRRGLDVLDDMMKKMEDGERIEVADIRAMLNFLQGFGDEYHQHTEETVLFPALVRAAPKGSPIHEMVLEHGEERALVAWIIEALGAKRVIDFVYSSHRLTTLLRSHIDKEDTVLRVLADQLLSNEEDTAVAAEFRNNHKEPTMFVNLPRLERKYRGKLIASPLARRP